MNTEAVRARNARKRAKLRAKARGDGPSMRRVRCTIRVWNNWGCSMMNAEIDDGGNARSFPCELCELAERCFNYWDSFGFYREFISGERLILRHEVTESDLVFWRVYAQNIIDSSSPCSPCIASLRVQQNGQERSREWRGTVEGVAADLVAAIEEGCTLAQ